MAKQILRLLLFIAVIIVLILYLIKVFVKCKKSTILFQGGIGNRLFQLAFISALTSKYNQDFTIISESTYHETHNYFDSILSKHKNRVIQNDDVKNMEQYTEPHDGFATFQDVPKPDKVEYYYTGYFQNEDYFREYKRHIINSLNLTTIETLPATLITLSKTKSAEPEYSYFIHIRRGDYLAVEKDNTELEIYYRNAINIILRKEPTAHFYIMSDDLDYCIQCEFLAGLNCTFYRNSNEIDTLLFMSRCKRGAICANSTFSWWGAYLNDNETKIVLFPNSWITKYDANGIYPYRSVITSNDYIYKDVRLTIVSGFWNVRSKYSMDEYLKMFDNTMRINCACVFFGDTHSISIMRKIRGNLPTIYVKLSLDDFYTKRFEDNIKYDNHHCPSPQVNMIWNEKILLVQKAKELNAFNSEFYLWYDAGLSLLRKKAPPECEFPTYNLDNLPRDKFIFTSSDNTIYENDKIGTYYHYISGVFILPTAFIDEFAALYKQYLDKYLPRQDTIYTEQVIYTLMYDNNPQLFYKIGHGYSEIVNILYDYKI